MGKKCKSSSTSNTSSSCVSSKCRDPCVITNKCAPIYYPNNYVGSYPYPCNPCPPKPCGPYGPYPPPCPPPYPPCPPPCPPQSCGPPYTANAAIISSLSSPSVLLTPTSPNVNIFNTTAQSIQVTLPSIASLGCCNYTKMFVISNLYNLGTNTVTAISSTDLFTSTGTTSSSTLDPGKTKTLYAVYVANGQSYWTD